MWCGKTSNGDFATEENDLLEDILANDNAWTTLVLEVVGLMCDGQHRTLQNYLRDQPDNFKVRNTPSINTSNASRLLTRTLLVHFSQAQF